MSHDKNIYPHIFGRHNIFFLRSMKGPYHIYLEADTQGEGQGDDDQEPGDGGQQPPAHPDTGLRLLACSCHVSRVTRHMCYASPRASNEGSREVFATTKNTPTWPFPC